MKSGRRDYCSRIKRVQREKKKVRTQGIKLLAKVGKAQQLREEEGRKILLVEGSHGGLAGTLRGGSMIKGEEMEREEKQVTYFPVYPNLRDAKRLKTGVGAAEQREREEVGEETRASYCD